MNKELVDLHNIIDKRKKWILRFYSAVTVLAVFGFVSAIVLHYWSAAILWFLVGYQNSELKSKEKKLWAKSKTEALIQELLPKLEAAADLKTKKQVAKPVKKTATKAKK